MKYHFTIAGEEATIVAKTVGDAYEKANKQLLWPRAEADDKPGEWKHEGNARFTWTPEKSLDI